MWNIFRIEWLNTVWNHPWTEYLAPALLAYVGVRLIISSYRRDPSQWLRRALPLNEDGKRVSCSARFGFDEYVYRGEPFHGARLDAFFGGIRVDLRSASISEDEEIEIHTWLGGVELIVSAEVNVVVQSRSFFGGTSNETAGRAIPNAPCLHILANNILGGVSIRNINNKNINNQKEREKNEKDD